MSQWLTKRKTHWGAWSNKIVVNLLRGARGASSDVGIITPARTICWSTTPKNQESETKVPTGGAGKSTTTQAKLLASRENPTTAICRVVNLAQARSGRQCPSQPRCRSKEINFTYINMASLFPCNIWLRDLGFSKVHCMDSFPTIPGRNTATLCPPFRALISPTLPREIDVLRWREPESSHSKPAEGI